MPLPGLERLVQLVRVAFHRQSKVTQFRMHLITERHGENKDVVTTKVAMNDRRPARVQVKDS